MARFKGGARRSMGQMARHEPGEFRALLEGRPVIPALRSGAELPQAVAAPSQVVYLLAASLSTLDETLLALRGAGKEVMLNLDLCAGLARDSEAVAYLASSGIAGVISTHSDVLGAAVSHGLYAVQRTFMIDSDSVESSMRSLRNFVPDALELMPAPVAPRFLPRLKERYGMVAAVGGGLVANLQEADALIRAGLDAVSTGKPELWFV